MRSPGRQTLVVAWLAAVSVTAACGGGNAERAGATATEVPTSGIQAPERLGQARPRIVALGDSLTAGLGLDPAAAFPALLQARVDGLGLPFEVVNAGVSGDTSAGGLRRADWALEGDVRVLIVALGGNDGLRGLPPEALRANLAAIIEKAQARGVSVVLAGLEAPPNLGPAYTAAFRDVYTSLAREYSVTLVPFLLAGVAGNDGLNQTDGIHPNLEGTRIVADHVWAAVHPLLDDEDARTPGPSHTSGPVGS